MVVHDICVGGVGKAHVRKNAEDQSRETKVELAECKTGNAR
jgi:hypothetical protein